MERLTSVSCPIRVSPDVVVVTKTHVYMDVESSA